MICTKMPFKEQLACGSRAFYLACAYRRAHADNNSQTGCVAQFVLNIHRASVRCGLTRAVSAEMSFMLRLLWSVTCGPVCLSPFCMHSRRLGVLLLWMREVTSLMRRPIYCFTCNLTLNVFYRGWFSHCYMRDIRERDFKGKHRSDFTEFAVETSKNVRGNEKNFCKKYS